jgi:hypothetical protein
MKHLTGKRPWFFKAIDLGENRAKDTKQDGLIVMTCLRAVISRYYLLTNSYVLHFVSKLRRGLREMPLVIL